MSADSIGARTLRGMAWAYGSYVGGRVLVLVSTALLARLLTPEDFGLVALALVFVSFLDVVADFGLSPALVVSRREDLEERAETVFATQVALGLALTLAVAALAPLAAMFFERDELLAIFPALGANFLLRSLNRTHYALAQRRLDFRARTGGELADVVVRGAVGITLALAGFGAWSLVLGYLAGTMAMTVVLWALVPWRPRLRPQRRHLRDLTAFGGTLSAVDVIAAVISQVDYLFVGKALGATALGLYTLAFRLPELLVLNLSVVASDVLFPAFAAVERAALGRAFLLSLRYTLMVGLPLAAGLAVLADPLVLAAFGPKWVDAAPAMQLLALYALAVTVGIPAGTVYKAVGRAGILLKLAIPRALLVIAAIAVFVDQGIVAVAACQAAVAIAFAAVGIGLASRLLGVPLREQWSAVWPTAVAAAGLAAAAHVVDRLIEPVWLSLPAAAAAGALAYGALLWLLAPAALRALLERARRRPAGDAPAAGGATP